MAGTTIAGRSGSVVLPGTPLQAIAFLTDWSIRVDADNYDQSALGDFWRSFVAGGGLRGWQGQLSGYYVADQDTNGQQVVQNAILNGTAITLQLQTGQGRGYYEGNVNITQMDVADNVRALITFAATFVGNGSLQHVP